MDIGSYFWGVFMHRFRQILVSLMLVAVLLLTGCSAGTEVEKNKSLSEEVGVLTEINQELVLDVEGKVKGKHVPGPVDSILGDSLSEERSPVVEEALHAAQEVRETVLDEKTGYYIDPASYIPNSEARVVIVLDPGHGGKYSGASQDEFKEQDIALRVAQYCRDYLIQRYSDVAVYLTREEDKELSQDSLALDLEARALLAQQVDADALVSLHFNASETHEQCGATVYVSRRDSVHDVSATFGEQILDRLSDLGLGNNGINTRDSNDMFDSEGNPYDYYAINRHCAKMEIPGIIVEHCYLDNAADYPFYRTDEAIRELAYADALGIAQFFELTLY